MRSARLDIYFDGGCRPNPGPIEIAAVARGIVYERHDAAYGGSMDAEWLALIHAAGIALRLGATDVLFLGDSSTVIAQAGGVGKCRAESIRSHRAVFTALVATIPRVRLRHVARSKNLAGIALARGHAR